jgi:hypothetical protein
MSLRQCSAIRTKRPWDDWADSLIFSEQSFARDLAAPQYRDENEKLTKLQEQSIMVVGFLGAAAFAGLVLILGNSNFILNATGEGGEGYLQEVAFILVFVSGMAGIDVILSFVAMAFELSNEGAKRVYYMTLILTMGVFVGFEIGLTFIFNAVNLGLAADTNMILSVIFGALLFLVVLPSRRKRET